MHARNAGGCVRDRIVDKTALTAGRVRVSGDLARLLHRNEWDIYDLVSTVKVDLTVAVERSVGK